MTRYPLRRRLSTLALTAATALVMAAPAQAAIYTGTFDPAFGGNFSGLGWEGTVVFDVPDACLALGTASFANTECQTTSLVSAQVRLYEYGDLPPLQTPDVLNLLGQFGIDDIDILGGTVVGLDASMTGFPDSWILPAGTLGASVASFYAAYRYGLNLDGDEATLRANSTNVDPSTLTDVAGGNCPFDDYAICTSSEPKPKITFTAVPEPGSLALAGLALLALAGVRRRRAA